MSPIWLIEAGVYGDEVAPLLAEIHRQGMIGAIIPYSALKQQAPTVAGECLGPGVCVIAYGTLPFARQIQLHHDWTPGAWCSPENLDCATYFAYFGRFLLNQNYAILPGVEAIRQRDWLYSVFGAADQVFARPTSCHKLFVGRCIRRDEFERALAPTRYDPTSLVVIARPRAVGREWRLVVLGDRIIAGGQYAENGARSLAPRCPDDVQRFGQVMLAEVPWRPDRVFMLDLCESEGQFRLVELNSFSCSWLYQCDMATVVRETSALARQLWERRYA